MVRHFLAQRWYINFAVAAGLHALGLGAGQAVAGCGPYTTPIEVPATWSVAPEQAHALRVALFQSGTVLMRKVVDESAQNDPIVGTWRFALVSDGTAYPAPIPAGAPVDFGTQQWHADATEFMISGARPPSTGDVCMGAWLKTGRNTYKLKHIALAWASMDSPQNAVSPAMFVGPAIIRETIKLSSAGDTFEGTFTIDQYAADGTTLLQHVGGTVTATRFTVD
jgi:hypothetical protein